MTRERFRTVHIEADGRRAFGIDGVRTAEAADEHNARARRFCLGLIAGGAIAVGLSYLGLPW